MKSTTSMFDTIDRPVIVDFWRNELLDTTKSDKREHLSVNLMIIGLSHYNV